MYVILRSVRVIGRGDGAIQCVDKLRHQIPMLRGEAVNVSAAVQIDDVIASGVLFRRDGPNKMAVEISLCDVVFAVQAW